MSDEESRRPGRPRLPVKPARVHVTVPATEYDRAFSQARRNDVSVPELLRRGLKKVLADDE